MLPPEKHRFDTIWGHNAAKGFVPRLLAAGRLPHAILLTGPDAIGKRSLAFAMAKAILSAGMPPSESTLKAPSAAPAKRRVEPGPPEDNGEGTDLFGEAEEDLFGGLGEEELDLFGGAEESESPAAPEPAPSMPEPAEAPPDGAPAKKKSPPKPPALRRAPTAVRRAEFTGFDERVCRLVEASYPPDADSDGRPTKAGHVDLTIIEPTKGRRGLVVAQTRHLQEAASRAPVEGAFRVMLIFGADTITQEAGNSLLKLLEEPPSYLIMILVGERLSRVLPTIKSRCSVVPMAPLEKDALVEALVERQRLDRELAKVAAALSECRPGVALEVVGKALLERRREVFQARLQVDRYGPPAIPAAVARINDKCGGLDEALWLLLSFARDRLVRAVAPNHEDLLVHGDATDLLDAAPPDPVAIDEEADRLIATFAHLAHPFTPNKKAPLELALWEE